jgi:hypothetical protein
MRAKCCRLGSAVRAKAMIVVRHATEFLLGCVTPSKPARVRGARREECVVGGEERSISALERKAREPWALRGTREARHLIGISRADPRE